MRKGIDMPSLRSDTDVWSSLAGFNRRKQMQYGLVVSPDWADYHFQGMYYVRPLRRKERTKSGYVGGKDMVWYGVFHPDRKHPVAVSDVLQNLIYEAAGREVQLSFRH